MPKGSKEVINQSISNGFAKQMLSALNLLGRQKQPAINAELAPVFRFLNQELPDDGLFYSSLRRPFDPIFNSEGDAL